MKYRVLNWGIALSIVATGLATGIPLIRYSEADDAPGGVMIGLLLMVGAVALAAKIALRDQTGRPSHLTIEERCRALESKLHAEQSRVDELQSQVAQLEEKLAFTQSLLASRGPVGSVLPPRV